MALAGTHISQLGNAADVQDVAGLDVAVNPGLLMQVAQRLSDRCYDFHHSLKRKTIWIRLQHLGEVATVRILRDKAYHVLRALRRSGSPGMWLCCNRASAAISL